MRLPIGTRLSVPLAAALITLALTVPAAHAQTNCELQRCQPETGHPLGRPGTDNIVVISHVPLPGERFSHADIDVEQEIARPFVYIAQRFGESGFYALSIEDPARPRILYRWTIDNPDLHVGSGGLDPRYAKVGNRYYLVLSFQFAQGGPDADLGAKVFDVTGLPDPSTVREVADLRVPDHVGGFHNIYTYKHSDGRALLFAATMSEDIYVYDLALVAGGNTEPVARIPVPSPEDRRTRQWHDMYVGYHPDSDQDRFYGAGTGGFHVFNITTVEDPELLTSVINIPGVRDGHTFTPTPDGKFALGISEPTYQHAPIRTFDLRPGVEGGQRAITGSGIGAWVAKFDGATHNHEIRWPYAFISGQDDGLQIINIMDPTDPYTQAYYITREGPMLYGPETPYATRGFQYGGVWGVDVRNADGLIVVSDSTSGFWAFQMEGFYGWNGNAWNMPNVSSAQDWDNGPVVQASRRPY